MRLLWKVIIFGFELVDYCVSKCYSIVHVPVMSEHHAMLTYKPNVNDSRCEVMQKVEMMDAT